MADVVCNIAKGRIVEYYNRVESNDPTNSAFIWVLCTGTETDDNCRDADTLTALLATSLNEATAGGYARVTYTDSDLAALPSPDDANNRYDLDATDIPFGAIAAGDSITRLVLCYDSDTTAGTDANVVPLIVWDFAVTTDGSNVTAVVNASGFFRAS